MQLCCNKYLEAEQLRWTKGIKIRPIAAKRLVSWQIMDCPLAQLALQFYLRALCPWTFDVLCFFSNYIHLVVWLSCTYRPKPSQNLQSIKEVTSTTQFTNSISYLVGKTHLFQLEELPNPNQVRGGKGIIPNPCFPTCPSTCGRATPKKHRSDKTSPLPHNSSQNHSPYINRPAPACFFFGPKVEV